MKRLKTIVASGIAILWLVTAAAATPTCEPNTYKDIAEKFFTKIRSFAEIKELRIMTYNVENLFWSTGRKEWLSTVEQVGKGTPPKPKPKYKIDGLKKTILKANPDILTLQEVESFEALRNFAETVLEGKYKPYLIEGNDQRGIDVGFLVKTDLPFDVEIKPNKDRTWIDPVTGIEGPVFSRDLPALILRKEKGGEPFLIILGNHAKSKRDRPGDPESTIWRTKQYEVAADIVRELQQEFGKDVPIILGGDFNTDVRTGPELAPIRKILSSPFDLFKRFTNDMLRITHSFHPRGEKPHHSQMDDLMVSDSLKDRVEEVSIPRYHDENGLPLGIPMYFGQREQQPSDHFPVFLRILTRGFWSNP